MKLKLALGTLVLCSAFFGKGQAVLSGGEIKGALKKFNTLGSVLYIAAHPDDENTRMIAWLANDRKYRTAYLSLTRGDGGQNLIGDEKGAKLGLIRTQELLAARRIDGGEQFFTRAVDFGYSRSAEESYQKWDKNEVLRDVVQVIRQYKPDVIITRFNPDGYNGHGHHTASALLTSEAFELAADPKAYPEQLERLEVWKAKRLLLNASTWWDKELPERAKTDPNILTVDVGSYNPTTGTWTNELASLSRSQHKSQGFGVSVARGSQKEYLKLTAGEPFKADMMDGVNIGWTRLPQGAMIDRILDELMFKFDPTKPASSIPELLRIKKELDRLPSSNWVDQKKTELNTIIRSSLGLFLEATTEQKSASFGEEVDLRVTSVLGIPADIVLESISYLESANEIQEKLSLNERQDWKLSFTNNSKQVSHPYWLDKNFESLFLVEDRTQIGKAENDPAISILVKLKIDGNPLEVQLPLRHRWTDRVEGEQQKPFLFLPEFTVNMSDPVMIFSGNLPKKLRVKVQSHKDGVSGKLRLYVPNSWKVEPQNVEVSFIERGEKEFEFTVTPPFVSGTGIIRAWVEKGKDIYDRSLEEMDFPHIEPQVYLPHAETKVVRLDLLNRVRSIAYVEGAGDEVAESLEQIGLKVKSISATELAAEELSNYECVVMGVRAYNTNEELKSQQKKLMDYVYEGGTLVVQYNTNRGLKVENFGPLDMSLGRGRVTEEGAKVSFLAPDHPILKSPNEITAQDFDDWVQERGLYFAKDWDEAYVPILEWNDQGEDPEKGGLLALSYGKGVFVYTGISFFRQLPAGVPGAYRLFANILSYRK